MEASVEPISIPGVQRAALTSCLQDVEQARNADVLAIFGPLVDIEERVRHALESLESVRTTRRGALLVLLHTTGGSIDSAERIVTVTRHFYPDCVEFLVPDYAMSAGTILAMSGDRIWMDYFSCLGPIDPQVQVRTSHGAIWVPALALLDQYERLQDRSRAGRLTELDVLMARSLNLAELRSYELERDRSIVLIKDWLVRYKFRTWIRTAGQGREVTTAMREERAEAIATQLQSLETWGSHSRGISMETLRRRLRLHVDDFGAEPELRVAVAKYHRLTQEFLERASASSLVHTRGHFR